MVSRVTKVTSDLESRVGRSDNAQLLDVVVELHPVEPLHYAGHPQAKMQALKEAFERSSTDVERTILAEGGEVVDRAWINRTVRARIPAKAIASLAQHDEISVIDVPHAIEPDQA